MTSSYRNIVAAAVFIALVLTLVQIADTFELTRRGAVPAAVLLAEALAVPVLLAACILSWRGRRPLVLLIAAALLAGFSAWWAFSKTLPVAVIVLVLASVCGLLATRARSETA